MKNKIIYFILSFCFIFFISCQKNKDNIAPTIELISPNENDTLTSTLSDYFIKFIAHDETELAKETISITDINGTVLSKENRIIHGTDYNYTNSFVFSGTKGQFKKLILEIKIEDKVGNNSMKSIPFFVKL
jgi:hypothetical protein